MVICVWKIPRPSNFRSQLVVWKISTVPKTHKSLRFGVASSHFPSSRCCCCCLFFHHCSRIERISKFGLEGAQVFPLANQLTNQYMGTSWRHLSTSAATQTRDGIGWRSSRTRRRRRGRSCCKAPPTERRRLPLLLLLLPGPVTLYLPFFLLSLFLLAGISSPSPTHPVCVRALYFCGGKRKKEREKICTMQFVMWAAASCWLPRFCLPR